MKLLKRMMTMVLAVFMFTALTACKSAPKVDPAVGYWKLTSMIDEDGVENTEDVQVLDELGLVVSLKINEDGSAVLDMFGETTDLTYAEGKMTLGEETINVTVDGDKLTMEEGGQSLVFTRAEEPVEE